MALTKIAGPENENALYAYNITLSDKSRSSRKLRQGFVNMLGREEQLGPKVINLLKEHYKTEPFAYPKKRKRGQVLKYNKLIWQDLTPFFPLIDLFAGAGGLSCGLGMAGFRPILANEINEIYANTYKTNNPATHTIVGDIRKVCELNLKETLGLSEGEVDLLAGGPPCQGFSINAPIRTLDDKRNHLFRDFLRVASALKPKAILIENVPGIISLAP